MHKAKLTIIGQEPEVKEKRQKPSKKGQNKRAEQVASVEPMENAESETERVAKENNRHKGKKYLAARAQVTPKKTYSLKEAAKLLKDTSISNFTGSVELHLVLTKDSVNTRIELPHSTGKTKKVEVASDETIDKLKSGKIDFDVLLASPDIMPKLVPYAKLLGPRGLMPNPKNGTLVQDTKKALAGFSGNTITVRTEKSAPLTHNTIAKVSQPEHEIEENIKAIFTGVGEKNIKKAVVSASMGPGILVSVA